MGIGSLFKNSSLEAASVTPLKRVRNTKNHKKLAKRVEDALKELDNALTSTSESPENLEEIITQAREVLNRAAETVAQTKRGSIDINEFAKEERTLAAAHDDILSLIPNLTQDKKNAQIEQARKAQEADRELLTELLDDTSSPDHTIRHPSVIEVTPSSRVYNQNLSAIATQSSIDHPKTQQSLRLNAEQSGSKEAASAKVDLDEATYEDDFERRTNHVTQMLKSFFETLPLNQIEVQDPKKREQLIQLQNVILTANERIKAVHQDQELITVSVKNLVEPNTNPYQCVVGKDSTVGEIIHQLLLLGPTGKGDPMAGEDGNDDDESDTEAPDLYRKTPISTIRPGGHWWQWLKDGAEVNTYAQAGGLELDYVYFDDEYTLAVVDDGTVERGLILQLVVKKRQKGAKQVQATVEEAVRQMIPQGRVLAIQSFSCPGPPKKPWTETPLTTNHFSARNTELYVEVGHLAI